MKIDWNDDVFEELRLGDQTTSICDQIADHVADNARSLSPNEWFESGILVKRRTRSRSKGGAGVLFLHAGLAVEAKHGTISKALNTA